MILKNILNFFEKQYKQRNTITCLLVAAIVLWIDYITGRHIQFPIIYVLPVGMVAWRENKFIAYTLAILLPFARIAFHFPWHETQALSIAFLNGLITLAGLFIYAYLILRITYQTKLLEKKVTVLEGILHICASCKKIQKDDGSWEQIEGYIQKHSEADFSHLICPDCMKKLYPEYVNDENTDTK